MARGELVSHLPPDHVFQKDEGLRLLSGGPGAILGRSAGQFTDLPCVLTPMDMAARPPLYTLAVRALA
jgi:hypothetical protein